MNRVFLVLISCALIGACESSPTGPVNCAPFLQGFTGAIGDTVTTPSGVRYIDVTTGTGNAAAAGNDVRVHYSGYFITGARFDTSCTDASPLSFKLGDPGYLTGFSTGIVGLKKSGVRRVILPLGAGYAGDTQQRIFDIELLSIGS